jgi:hypothetical protein
MFLAIVSPRIPQVVAICSLVTSTFPDGEWHGFPSGMVQSKPPPFVWRIVVSYLAIVSPSDTNRLHHLQQIRHALFDLRISTNYSRSQYSNYKWKKKSQTSLQCCFTLSNIRIVATNQVNLFFTIAIAIYSITPWNQSKITALFHETDFPLPCKHCAFLIHYKNFHFLFFARDFHFLEVGMHIWLQFCLLLLSGTCTAQKSRK